MTTKLQNITNLSQERLIAPVGRIKSWIDEPTGRYPISCTQIAVQPSFRGLWDSWYFVSQGLRGGSGVALDLSQLTSFEVERVYEYKTVRRLKVLDSMEGKRGIEASWEATAKAILNGERVCINLTNLRASGENVGIGGVSSGPVAFAYVYDVIARVFKATPGQVSVYIDSSHKDAEEFKSLVFDYIDTSLDKPKSVKIQDSSPPSETVFIDIVSLLALYSCFNEVLRRGGVYKNGAVVAYLDISHPEAKEYLELDRNEAPWLKRALYVSNREGDVSYLPQHPLYDLVVERVRDGSMWLAKKRWEHPDTGNTINYAPNESDVTENRLYSQVCTEILIPSRGTCTLTPVNLGQCTIRDIPKAYRIAARFLSQVHSSTGAGRSNMYLSPREDKQVGIGAIGLCNLLARYRVRYAIFAQALEYVMDAVEGRTVELYSTFVPTIKCLSTEAKVAVSIATALYDGHIAAADYLRKRGFKRAFAIAPTANVSYSNVDLNGYTTAPEISPAIANEETKLHTRRSKTFGDKEYQYPPNCETAASVGPDVYFQLANQWQRMMESTGMAHAISFNVHDTVDVDSFIPEWLNSYLVSTYYRMNVTQDIFDKSDIGNVADGHKFTEIVPEDSDTEFKFDFLTPEEDPNYCAVCAG